MGNHQRGLAFAGLGHGPQRNLAAVGRLHIDALQRVDLGLPVGVHLEHDIILIGRRIDGRDPALAECAVQRVVDDLRRDAELGGAVAVNVEDDLEPAILQVGADIAQLRQCAEPREQYVEPVIELLPVLILQGELELALALAGADIEILDRLQIGARARQCGERFPQFVDDRR